MEPAELPTKAGGGFDFDAGSTMLSGGESKMAVGAGAAAPSVAVSGTHVALTLRAVPTAMAAEMCKSPLPLCLWALFEYEHKVHNVRLFPQFYKVPDVCCVAGQCDSLPDSAFP